MIYDIGRYLLLVFSLVMSSAVAEQSSVSETIGADRVALVIGNSSYENINNRLKNPANDAKAIAAKLRSLDIDVIEAIDLDYRGMRDALRMFDRALQDADAGLFFYAGHGMEYRGRNYLFPTDVILETEGDIGLSLIDIKQVLQVMETAVPTRLIFLDACRNNPLASRIRRNLAGGRTTAVSKGLGRIDASVGTFIAYATAPGEVAVDGDGNNSPFTTALLQYLDEPGLEISQLMHKVRNSVIEATNERQIPWESSSLRGPFVLNPKTTAITSAVAALATADEGNLRVEKMYWDSIKDDGRVASFEAYLELFGKDGLFAPLALARIEEQESGAPKVIGDPPEQGQAIEQIQPPEQREMALDFDRQSVQENLSALGYYDGDADGLFDERTRLAIQEWQQDTGVEATGYLEADQVNQITLETGAVVAALDAARTDFFDEKQTDRSKPEKAGRSKPTQTLPVDQTTLSADFLSNQSAEDILDRYVKYIDVSALEVRAKAGDGAASVVAGLAYILGRDVDQDYTKARGYLRQGCKQGIARSCHSLGTLYENGLGVEQDYDKARQLFDQGCESGVARSCRSLGYLYQNGIGADQDYAKAQMLYRRACYANDADGCVSLGYLYDEGLGVGQDHQKARELFQKGCQDGDPHACTNLGYHYDQGLGVSQDYAKARDFYQKGCEGGSGSACANLGYLYDGGLGVDPDYVKAKQLYQKGCDIGHPRACSNLGNLYDGGLGVEQDYARARTFYEKGCLGGHASGCNNLGDLYAQGLGVDADATTARDLYRKACDLEDVRFCEKLLQ
ncbi:MAG: caspase family protein [Geminicoccaceae bacterium]